MSTTVPQRMRALERANQVRLARAALRHKVASGEVSAASVLRNTPPEAITWAIGDVLISQRRWGRTKTLALLARLHIVETKALGALTGHQRDQIIRALGEEPGVTG